MKHIEVILKKRPFISRLTRLPKLIRHNWEFTKGGKLKERIIFTFEMIKIVMK